MEEPEKNIVGFFITTSISRILPTIKSRCEIFKLSYPYENLQDLLSVNDEQYLLVDETLDLAFKLNSTKKYVLMNQIKNIAKKERVEIETILDILRKVYIIKYDYLTFNKRRGMPEFLGKGLEKRIENEIKDLLREEYSFRDYYIESFNININDFVKNNCINKETAYFLCSYEGEMIDITKKIKQN